MVIKVSDIIKIANDMNISYELKADSDMKLEGYSHISRVKENTMILFSGGNAENIMSRKDILILCNQDDYTSSFLSAMYLECPERLFIAVIDLYWNKAEKNDYSCDNIKSRFPNANVKFGKNVFIDEGVCMYGEVVLGDNVHIKSGAVIGQTGYVYLDVAGNKQLIPSNGGVIIGDNVDIGANSCVDRGVYDNTIIGNGVKISNLCQVANDVHIGDNTTLATKVSISSNTDIGKSCSIGAGVTIKDNIVIGDKSFVGMGSVVTKCINPSSTVFGNPAIDYVRKKRLYTVNGVDKSYENTNEQVLSGLSFELCENEIVAILGPSGCGKTTILKIMAGIIPADKGGCGFDNPDKKLGLVFQEDALLPWFNVEKNIALGLKIKKIDKRTMMEKVSWAVNLVGLNGYEKYYPHQLSGGMRKRVAIARNIVMDSKLLLLDESFSALDASTKKNIQDDLKKLIKKESISICMVTHDVDEAMYMANRILIIGGKPAKVLYDIPVNPNYANNVNSDEYAMFKSLILEKIDECKDLN